MVFFVGNAPFFDTRQSGIRADIVVPDHKNIYVDVKEFARGAPPLNGGGHSEIPGKTEGRQYENEGDNKDHPVSSVADTQSFLRRNFFSFHKMDFAVVGT